MWNRKFANSYIIPFKIKSQPMDRNNRILKPASGCIDSNISYYNFIRWPKFQRPQTKTTQVRCDWILIYFRHCFNNGLYSVYSIIVMFVCLGLRPPCSHLRNIRGYSSVLNALESYKENIRAQNVSGVLFISGIWLPLFFCGFDKDIVKAVKRWNQLICSTVRYNISKVTEKRQ